MQQKIQRARLTEVVHFLEKATSGRPVGIDPVDRITGRKPNLKAFNVGLLDSFCRLLPKPFNLVFSRLLRPYMGQY